MFRYSPARGQEASCLTLTLSEEFLPGAVNALPGNSKREREARKLVPMVPLPPLLPPAWTQPSQVSLAWEIMAELTRRADELMEHGGVLFQTSALKDLANIARLPLHILDELIDAWLTGTTNVPPFLAEAEPKSRRFTLSAEHSGALALLQDGGQRMIVGRKRGVASANSKKAGRFKQRRRGPG